MIFLTPRPISGAAPSFITTVQVIPALTNTPGGTCVIWTVTGMRCASRTQVNVGLTEERSSGPSLLSSHERCEPSEVRQISANFC
jgi:hypothetical protein